MLKHFARPLLRRIRRTDDGVTLTELLVTMVVLGILVSATVLMVSASMRVSSGNKERLDQSNSASIAMQRVSRTLRTAVLQSQLTTTCTLAICTESAFLKGTRTSVQFYADVDNPKNSVGPSRVTYDITGGVLTETVQKPDSPTPDAAGYHYCTPGPGCAIRTTVLATDVQTTGPVFSFYTAADPVNAIVLTTGQQLTAAQLKAVDSIDVSLVVQRAGGANVAGASMIQRVALPNADSVVRTDGT
jgi:prepilin-type N-terminal cleavage/methylation domain-containing protein